VKFEELSARYRISRGTVQNELERARQTIKRHSDE
jgi:predicted DNA-binding protein (UPF0251 family)